MVVGGCPTPCKTEGECPEGICPWGNIRILQVQAGASCDGDIFLYVFLSVCLFVCLSVCLSPETRTQKAVASKTNHAV